MRFAPGRLIVHRNVRHGQIGWVRPARVVSDDERGLLVWLAPGSAVGGSVAADGRGIRAMPFAEWVTLEHRVRVGAWQGHGLLKLVRPGAAHSVWWFRGADGSHKAWYVNLEAPAVRWDDGHLAGVDITDQDLDIWVEPDRTWRWKDEDEFAERLALADHYWVPEPDQVWAEGRRVVAVIEAGAFPFDGSWCDFVPDPSWPTPTVLPDGWDRPAVR
ncbi:DUF402 domain-containing protein [Pilimelia columellifera]|uniref:DUF402 domain-containing protein n=1 Tax=Pilimelia columellifera subsp. columellifera TaxID=706583 RepID=A0ABN3N3Q3_9ACTN